MMIRVIERKKALRDRESIRNTKEKSMNKKKSKCRHPGLGRRLIARFSGLGTGFASRLHSFAIFLEKVANTLKFEHFWKREVQSNPEVVIVDSFTRSRSKHAIWNIAIEHVKGLGESGQVYEFGTNNGGSLYYFWQGLPRNMQFHGFDTFTGIPENWDSLPPGSIRGYGYPYELWREHPEQRAAVEEEVQRTGRIPAVPQKNIHIHKGLFAHTLPELLANGPADDIRLIHFDADIYMGTRPVLDSLCGQIDYRYYILFDELYSVNHEFKAWIEFVRWFEVEQWKVVAISEDGVQALIQVN